MITNGFLEHVANRTWTGVAAAVNYRVMLATDDLLTELVGSGYAQAPLTSWTKGAAYEAIAQCAGFENTGGTPWPTATRLCVLIDGLVCWTEAISVTLLPSEHLTFPDGIRFSLRDAYA